jgi:hypothetical protein
MRSIPHVKQTVYSYTIVDSRYICVGNCSEYSYLIDRDGLWDTGGTIVML